MTTCEELGIGLVPYSPLGRGYLTGTINENTKFASVDIRSRNPRFTQEAIKANRVVIELLERIGAKKGGATPPQVVLAWVLAPNIRLTASIFVQLHSHRFNTNLAHES